MILRSKLLWSLPLLFLSVAAGYAQQAPPPGPAQTAQPSQSQAVPPAGSSQVYPTLTLDQAEALALKNHPQIQYARYNALASEQLVREVRSAYFPTVYGSITGSVADRNTRIGAGYIDLPSLWNRFGSGLSIDQLITDSGRTPNLVASSRLQDQAARQDVFTSRYDVLLAVDQAYFEILRSEALLQVAQKTVGERQVVVDQVSAMVKNQLKSQLDLSFVQVNLAQAKLLEISAQNDVDKSFAQLSRTLGTSKYQEYTLQQRTLPQPPPPSAEDLVSLAMANRPELASLRYSRQSAYKFQKAEKDLSLPTVTAQGDAGVLPEVAQLLLPRIVPNHYEAAFVNVNVPIFNGHLFAARRTEAMMQARAADQKLRNVREQIARDVRAAWADATTGYQRIAVTQQLLDEARMGLALAQGRYNLGLGSVVELTEGQLNELQAEVENVNAKYDYQIQDAVLQYQIGNLR
ncbi:MAG TPA: TolC family protein [Terriglobia bacterium]|nr:TolC family protein [Terriglobia bacterium]